MSESTKSYLSTALLSLLAAGIFLCLTPLIPSWKWWYSSCPSFRLQTEALLRGELAVRHTPLHHLHDWAWGNGMHQLWGLGVPLIRLPFEAAARCFGGVAFPDRFVFLILFMAVVVIWWRKLEQATELPYLSRLVILSLVLFQPGFVLLCQARFQEYEEAIATGCLWALLLAGLLSGKKLAKRDFLLACAAAGFASWIRPTFFFYGLATWVAATYLGKRESHFPKSVHGLGTFLFGVGVVGQLVTNELRFGSPFEFGHHLSSSQIGLSEVSLHFNYLYRSEPWLLAVRELFTALTYQGPFNGFEFFSSQRLGPGFSNTFRFREMYFPGFWLSTIVTLIGVWLYPWLPKAKLRNPRLSRSQVALTLWSAGTFFILFLFYLRTPGISSRYISDFLPSVAVGLAMGYQYLSHRFAMASPRLFHFSVLALGLRLVTWNYPSLPGYAYRMPVPFQDVGLFRRGWESSKDRLSLPEGYRCRVADVRQGVPSNGFGWDWGRTCKLGRYQSVYLPAARCLRLELRSVEGRVSPPFGIKRGLDSLFLESRVPSGEGESLRYCSKNQSRRSPIELYVFAWANPLAAWEAPPDQELLQIQVDDSFGRAGN